MLTSVYAARNNPSFQIGWDPNSQMNDYQLRKSKNKEVTGKITTQNIIQGQEVHQERSYQGPTPKDCNWFPIQTRRYSMKTLTSPKKNWKNTWISMSSTELLHLGGQSRVLRFKMRGECQSVLGKVWKKFCLTVWELERKGLREVPVYPLIYQAE